MSFTEPTPEISKACTEIHLQFAHGELSWESAMKKLNEMLKEAKKQRHLPDQARIYNVMGILYSVHGQLTESINSYRQSMSMAKLSNQVNQTAISAMNMGGVYRQKGDYKEALKHFDQAFAISKDLTIWSIVPAGALLNMGETLYLSGNYQASLDKLREAVERIETTWPENAVQRPSAFAEAYAYMGHVYLQFKDIPATIEAAAKATQYSEKYVSGLGMVHRLYGELFTDHPNTLINGISSDPDEHYAKAIGHFKEINVIAELGRTFFMQAESRRKRKCNGGIQESYLEAIGIFVRLGMSKQLNAALQARMKFTSEKQ